MRQRKQRKRDVNMCEFKSYPTYLPPKIIRPMFPEMCSCLSDSEQTSPDKLCQTLSLMDFLRENSAMFSCDSEAQRMLKSHLGSQHDSLLFHTGQLEVLRQLKHKNLVVILDEASSANVLCLLSCLSLIGFSPSSVLDSLWKNLPPAAHQLYDKIKLLDSRSEESIVAEDWGNLAVISQQTFMEAIHTLDPDTMLLQCVVSRNERTAHINFSHPICVDKLQNNSITKDKEEGTVVDVFGHLSFIRNKLVKPSLEECVQFILENKDLFDQTNIKESLIELRRFIWENGGDVGFLPGDLDEYVLPDQNQPSGRSVGRTGYSCINNYLHVESVLAVAIKSLIPGPLQLYKGDQGLTIERGKILYKAEQLVDILGSKALFQYPCDVLISGLFTGLDRLQCRGITLNKNKTRSQSAVKARRKYLELDSDSEEELDTTELNVVLTDQTIAALEQLAGLLRRDLVCVDFCITNLPFLPIRLNDFIQIVQNDAKEKRGLTRKSVDLDSQDVERAAFSLIMSGVLERADLRGETWIQTREKYASETSIDQLLYKLTPFLAF